jgi:hypothetical protein
VGKETVYTKHQNLPQTSKHYKQSLEKKEIAKTTTLGIVLHARSCAMGGEDVVAREVKGVEEVGV